MNGIDHSTTLCIHIRCKYFNEDECWSPETPAACILIMMRMIIHFELQRSPINMNVFHIMSPSRELKIKKGESAEKKYGTTEE